LNIKKNFENLQLASFRQKKMSLKSTARKIVYEAISAVKFQQLYHPAIRLTSGTEENHDRQSRKTDT
jgi:hypothetical protein